MFVQLVTLEMVLVSTDACARYYPAKAPAIQILADMEGVDLMGLVITYVNVTAGIRVSENHTRRQFRSLQKFNRKKL